MHEFKAIVLGITLIALGYFCWYFASAPLIVRLDKETLAKTADITIQQLRIRQYDESGQLRHALFTPTLHHIPLDNTNVLDNPFIQLKQENQPLISIRAKQASSIHGNEKITFNHQVVIHQAKDDQHAESTFKTSQITYFPKHQLATTSKPVLWQQGTTLVKAVGMKADLGKQQVKLLSDARGVYDPNEKKS